MNLADGQIESGVFTAENMQISCLPTQHSGAVTLDFRAEDVSVSDIASEVGSRAYSLELLGEAMMVAMKVGKTIRSAKIWQRIPRQDWRGRAGACSRWHLPIVRYCVGRTSLAHCFWYYISYPRISHDTRPPISSLPRRRQGNGSRPRQQRNGYAKYFPQGFTWRGNQGCGTKNA